MTKYIKTESEIQTTHANIMQMGLQELYETLKLEVEEATEENNLYELPTLKRHNKELNPKEVLKLAENGLKLKIDIRYILTEAFESKPYLNQVKVDFLGTYEYIEFLKEIEERTLIMKRILKRIFQPMDMDTRAMEYQ